MWYFYLFNGRLLMCTYVYDTFSSITKSIKLRFKNLNFLYNASCRNNIQNHFSCTTWTLRCELFGGSASCPQCCISASIPSTHKCNPEPVLWLKLFIYSFLPLVFYNFGSEYVTLWPECVTILALTVLQFCLWMYYNL